jgi:microcompartment protein CcmL/EutN
LLNKKEFIKVMHPAIGLLEYNSIAKGIEATDAMLKKAVVELIEAHPVCAGKYITLITGDVDAVSSSLAEGEEVAANFLVDRLLIPNVHPQVFPALRASVYVENLQALGIIETFTAASSIIAADAAAKASEVQLLEIRLANGMGGKSFFTLSGDVGAVEAALRAGVQSIAGEGWLVEKVIIPGPHKDMERVVL